MVCYFNDNQLNRLTTFQNINDSLDNLDLDYQVASDKDIEAFHNIRAFIHNFSNLRDEAYYEKIEAITNFPILSNFINCDFKSNLQTAVLHNKIMDNQIQYLFEVAQLAIVNRNNAFIDLLDWQKIFGNNSTIMSEFIKKYWDLKLNNKFIFNNLATYNYDICINDEYFLDRINVELPNMELIKNINQYDVLLPEYKDTLMNRILVYNKQFNFGLINLTLRLMNDKYIDQKKYSPLIIEKLELKNNSKVEEFFYNVMDGNRPYDILKVDLENFDSIIKRTFILSGIRPKQYNHIKILNDDPSGVHRWIQSAFANDNSIFFGEDKKVSYKQIWFVATQEEKTDAINNYLKFLIFSFTGDGIKDATRAINAIFPTLQNENILSILPKLNPRFSLEEITSNFFNIVIDDIQPLSINTKDIKTICEVLENEISFAYKNQIINKLITNFLEKLMVTSEIILNEQINAI